MADSPTDKRTISDLDLRERPRERLMAHGAGALSNAELLAILIGSGSMDENAVDLMRRVLHDCGDSLKNLGRMDVDDFCQYKGIGPAKALTLIAACELGKRRVAEGGIESPAMRSSEDIYHYFQPMMADLPVEEFHVLLLNNKLSVIGEKRISQGGLTGSVVDVRLILRAAIVAKATAIALCHNHPSGMCRPSREDESVTRKIQDAARVLDLKLIDHVIVARDRYYSFSDEGKLS